MASVSAMSRPHLRTVWNPNESDELLRLAIQVGGIGIFESDLRRKRTRFSPELCAILGMPVGTEMPYEEASLCCTGTWWTGVRGHGGRVDGKFFCVHLEPQVGR
jgi:hypothetical protein